MNLLLQLILTAALMYFGYQMFVEINNIQEAKKTREAQEALKAIKPKTAMKKKTSKAVTKKKPAKKKATTNK